MNICLEGDCQLPYCVDLAHREFATLDGGGYHSGQSVMPLPENVGEHLAGHKTFRTRSARAERMGYYVARIEPRDYHDDYQTINRSKRERQGRPMAPHYWDKVRTTGRLGEPKCQRHHILEYAVLRDDHAWAYSTIYRCGQLVHVSMFLGHADYLDDGIMYLLTREILRDQAPYGRGVLYYNYHNSGTPGLRWFKEKIGLQAEDIEWMLTT